MPDEFEELDQKLPDKRWPPCRGQVKLLSDAAHPMVMRKLSRQKIYKLKYPMFFQDRDDAVNDGVYDAVGLRA